jgi:hypothetical protein
MSFRGLRLVLVWLIASCQLLSAGVARTQKAGRVASLIAWPGNVCSITASRARERFKKVLRFAVSFFMSDFHLPDKSEAYEVDQHRNALLALLPFPKSWP